VFSEAAVGRVAVGGGARGDSPTGLDEPWIVATVSGVGELMVMLVLVAGEHGEGRHPELFVREHSTNWSRSPDSR
jgi:hypothetical protein